MKKNVSIEKVSIEKVSLVIGGKTIELTLEQAKELKGLLNDTFPDQPLTPFPLPYPVPQPYLVPQPYPIRPRRYNRWEPTWTDRTCTAGLIAFTCQS